MNRWVLFVVCAVLGLGLVVGGLFVPIHLRALDTSVVQRAGKDSPSLLDHGAALVQQKNLGAAQLLLEAAGSQSVPGSEKLGFDVGMLKGQHPDYVVWGGGETHLEVLFGNGKQQNPQPEPFTDFVIREANRTKILALLQASPQPLVQELLRGRALTNTTIFSPSASSAGQALDAAICTCGLLLEEAQLNSAFSNQVFTLASQANRGASPQPLEQVLLDLMSLAQRNPDTAQPRFNWGQLSVFVHHIPDAETLRILGNLVRRNDTQLPLIFSTVEVSGNPAGVAKYLMTFSQTGLNDLGAALKFGQGGLNEVLTRNQRLTSTTLPRIGVDYCLRMPAFALTIKWLLYLAGGFFLAAAMHFARPPVSVLERPLQVRGFHYAREILFALGFLLVVLLLSEPFLAQESQKVEFPFRLRLSTVGSAVQAGNTSPTHSFMNRSSMLTLLLFFILQALIYISCLVKLAEIRRQRIPPRMKLKLLENEEHLFDAGLYLGFAGTIISLILVSLNVIQQSLMAAYGSTSFGILFVVVFKIFNLRPARRQLLLESETPAAQASAQPAGARAFATTSP
ncbi:MAG TPA: hypothetical protein VFA77_12930 [Candidatus Eisenbacteria bacterium]|nr:hypothetical protein [Candidatus Eisenbacteria bacterium]